MPGECTVYMCVRGIEFAARSTIFHDLAQNGEFDQIHMLVPAIDNTILKYDNYHLGCQSKYLLVALKSKETQHKMCLFQTIDEQSFGRKPKQYFTLVVKGKQIDVKESYTKGEMVALLFR